MGIPKDTKDEAVPGDKNGLRRERMAYLKQQVLAAINKVDEDIGALFTGEDFRFIRRQKLRKDEPYDPKKPPMVFVGVKRKEKADLLREIINEADRQAIISCKYPTIESALSRTVRDNNVYVRREVHLKNANAVSGKMGFWFKTRRTEEGILVKTVSKEFITEAMKQSIPEDITKELAAQKQQEKPTMPAPMES